MIATDAYYNAGLGTPLANITALSYSTFQPGPALAISIQFDVRYRSGDIAYGGRLVFEPYQNGAVVVGAGWQSWSPLAGTWWASKTTAAGTGGAQVVALPAGNCAQPTPCTWAQIKAAFPSAVILGRFLLKAGSNWTGFDGNADNLTIGLSGVNTTFDFEAETPCTMTCYVNGATGNDAFGGDTPASAKKTIQAALNQVSIGGAVHVAPGTYNEDLSMTKANVQLLGAGIDVSTIVGPIGGPGATIQVAAGGVLVDGFTITRAGNNVTDWNGALNSAGVAVQSQGNTVELRNSKLTGNRTGVDINNSNGNSVHNNIIDNNRTGMLLRNTTDNTSVVNNFITNNWTLGVLFLDGSGGTNVPVQSAAGSTFSNNSIKGNWYGQVEDRQAGGSIPAAPANPKNFKLNWWGTTAVAVSTVQGTEPGYSAQIPVAFGGTATAPGGQPDIKGTASANIDYNPLQCSGTDTSPAIGFQPSGVLCAPPVTTVVTASSMTATGWVFYNDQTDVIDPTLGSFVAGPGTPVLGTGSAQISVIGAQRRNLATYQFAGTPLANISALRFRTYNPSAGNPGPTSRSAYLNFNVDFNGSDTWQKRLVFVPSQNGTVVQNTWKEWDAINGGAALWGYSGATWPITGQPGTTLKTWSQILIDYPGVRVRVTDAFMGLRVGEPYTDGYTENIDTFTFGSPAGTTIFNFENTPQCTMTCYVNGTTGNDAFDGSTATSAKKTIQGGVNQVSSGGTVQVAAGTFNENVTISTPLTLAGASAATTIVRPAISNPNCGGAGGGSLCAGSSNIILVQANNVTIHDIGLDGDNPALTSGIVQAGADLDARNGIITNHVLGVYQNLVVHHSTIKNIYLRGIYASSGGSFNFHDNTVQNVQANPASIAMFNFGGSGTFANNTVSGANDGISSNWSTGTQYLNNVITGAGSGIHTDNNGGSGGVADLIQGNTVSACQPNGYGVWTFAPFLNLTVTQNTITGCAVGLAAAGQNGVPAVTTTFSDNAVDGLSAPGSVGAYITTDRFGFGTTNVAATLTGNIIKNNAVGIDADSQAGYTATINATRNAIFGNGAGVALTNTPTPPVVLGIGTFILNMTPNWWGDISGPAHALNPGGIGNAVPNGVTYSPWIGIGTDSSPSAGFQLTSPMTWIAGPAVCGATCIQAAIDDAANGDTVKAKTGVFPEHVIVNKSITLTAASNPIIDGGGTGTGIAITASNVTVSLIEVRNVQYGITSTSANNVTIASNNVHGFTCPSACGAAGIKASGGTGLNIATNTIDDGHVGSCHNGGVTLGHWGIYVTGASGTINGNNVTGIGNALTTGCQEGRAIEAAGSGTVSITNNIATTYQKSGIIVRDTVNSVITGNTTTGEGPSSAIAQNGITITSTGTTSITGNHTSGHLYSPGSAFSCGILLFGSGATVSNNDSTNDEVGVCVAGGTGAQIKTNIITKHHQQGVNVDGATNVLVDGNTIDGQGGGTTATPGTDPDTDLRYYGVFVVDSTGTVSNNIIKGITHGPANGLQSGVGIKLTARAGVGSANVSITGNNISDVQKNAMVITNQYGGVSVNAIVSGNTVAGNGPISYIAQNGIQISNGATAVVSANNVSGYDYTPSTWAAVGILLYGAGTTSVNNNVVHDLMEGLFVVNTNWISAGGNSFTNYRDTAIYAENSNNGVYTVNTMMGKPGSTGMYFYSTSINNSVQGSAVRNNDNGVIIDYTGGAATGNTFAQNCIAGNTVAGMSTLGIQVGGPVNAQNNWWGKINGANPPGHGDKISPPATINAVPFLTAPVAGCPVPLDGDGDGVNDAVDNCPVDYNPAQTNTDQLNYLANRPGSDGLGDACDPNISGDGYTNAQHTAIGKNPALYCAIMRADVDGDGVVSILDLVQVAQKYGQAVPPNPSNTGIDTGIQRLNQDGDSQISILDLVRVASYYTQPVTNCP